MKHRDMFKLLEGENGHIVVVGDDDDDDDVICCLPLRRGRALIWGLYPLEDLCEYS